MRLANDDESRGVFLWLAFAAAFLFGVGMTIAVLHGRGWL